MRRASPRTLVLNLFKGNDANELPEHASTNDGPDQLVSAIRILVDMWESGVR
jgi:hypothetical protein